MFAIHGRLVTIADQEFKLPTKLVAKMNGNIAFDLLISLPPIIGSLFSWLNGCSTRNAALLHTYLVKKENAKDQERQQNVYAVSNRPENLTGAHLQAQQRQAQQNQRGRAPPGQQLQTSQAQTSNQTSGTYQSAATNKYAPGAQQQTSTSAQRTSVPIKKPPPAAYNVDNQTQNRGRRYY